ncbi:MAG: AlwI family type II restriction endonuclease [Prevotella sp.]|nr:AlwI family type II restriction endonuclease [Prevotella sp.]
MSKINSRTLFLTTSPRTPNKMIPEIALLVEHFTSKKWNKESQCAFMDVLKNENFFNGKGENDPSFSARDRINRAPKSLGFVRLSPTIELTPAGKKLITSRRKDEIFLRQMLKFQVPSPYHKPSSKAAKFCVKPYLEMLRLVRRMGTLKFDELQMFGMQLTDWHDFESIVQKIELFRIEKAKHKGSYRVFKSKYLNNELKQIYEERIKEGETQTRESADTSLEKFLCTQSANMRDYADSCFRYLRATGLVNVSQVGKSLSIVPERTEDVDFLLEKIERNPLTFESEAEYCTYLGNANTPELLTDNRANLLEKLHAEFVGHTISETSSTEDLKDLLGNLRDERRDSNIKNEIKSIKEYKFYEDIQSVFSDIVAKKFYDNPVMLEWNTWRAMTMLDGGDIKANLNFDDFGKPLSTAAGNMADIVCDYGDFLVTVEVTMASGQKQFEMEGEPVSRHLGKLKVASGKPCYCLFIAPTINDASISFFYMLHKTNLVMYGGKSTIVPLPLTLFQKMVEDSYRKNYLPSPDNIKAFFETSNVLAQKTDDESLWFKGISEKAMNWLG